MTLPPAEPDARDAAVIDIGSNSVRLVVYRLEGRAIWTAYNEKVLAGLGRDLPRTGRLSPEGVAAALPALKRFRALVDALAPEQLHVVATAAVREAEDGLAFRERVAAETGLSVRVLSGEEEARYAAEGVLAGAPGAAGVAADLGGSSLEVVSLDQGRARAGVTLPLGPFAMGERKGGLAQRIDQRLSALGGGYAGETLHAVGGAWRSLALLHMRMTDHDLHIVHQYEMAADEVALLAELLSKQSKGSLERTRGVSRRRVEALPHAALVLARLMRRLRARRVSFSAYGLREGLLHADMDPALRAEDPLVAGCEALGGRRGVAEGLGRPLAAWLAPLVETLEPQFGRARDAVLLRAACALSDIGARLHPDHRAEVAFEQVLRAPIPGQNHAERAFLAMAIHARYGGRGGGPEPGLSRRLLGETGLERARLVGLAMRFGSDIAGRAPALLASLRLSVEPGQLVVRADGQGADLVLGEQTAKRGAALASALGLDLRLTGA